MTRFSGKARLHKQLFLILFACLLLPVLARAGLQLAGFTFAYAPAKSLSVTTHLSKGLKSYGFVSGVGGVAFGAIASPQNNITVMDIKYDSKKPDGNRLVVIIKAEDGKRHEIVAPVADWIMIPIARFANRDQHAIFTLFGNLKDEQQEKKWRKQHARILNYHPAVENTLIGLRLFQADLLAFHPAGGSLLKDAGQYVKGTGEDGFSLNLEARGEIEKLYGKTGARSYVICDQNQNITFSHDASVLKLEGFPYWACWRLKKDLKDIYIDYIRQSVMDHQSEIIAETKRAYEKQMKGSQEIQDSQIKAFMRPIVKKYQLKALQDKAAFNNYVDSHDLMISLDNGSKELSGKMRELKGGNPVVYNALTTSMRYAAFFRYVKKEKPLQFAAFVKSVGGVSVSPDVMTPTVMIPPPQKSAD